MLFLFIAIVEEIPPVQYPFPAAGVWDTMAAGETFETVLNGPGLCTANHKDNGTTETHTSDRLFPKTASERRKKSFWQAPDWRWDF